MVKQKEDNEYEVEYLNSHRIGQKNGKKRLEYEVKWRGYPRNENTWESSDSVSNAMSLVDQYWEIKGGGRKARVACERSLKKPISDDEKETSSEDELDDSEEEALVTRLARRKTSPAAAKTTTARTDSNKRKATSSYQIPAKKTISADKTASTGVTKTTTEQPKSDEDENADEDFSESEIRTNNFRLHHNGWATDAEKVIEVRVVDNGELHGLLKWRDGKLGLYKTSELAERVPHLLIEYYEKKLTFQPKPSV